MRDITWAAVTTDSNGDILNAGALSLVRYTLERRLRIGSNGTPTNWVQLVQDLNTTTYRDLAEITTLDVQYRVRVQESTTNLMSGWLESAWFIALPATPSAPVLSSRTTTSLTVQVATVPGATSYRWRYATNSSFTNAILLAPRGTEIVITGLNPGTIYYVDVQARNDAGDSAYSEDLMTSTIAVTLPPTVTYNPASPTTTDTSITAILSYTAGLSDYQWQAFNIAAINPSWQDVAGQTSLVYSDTLLENFRYRLTWIRSGTREVASFVTVTLADPPTVTYDPASPTTANTSITATLSYTAGLSDYQWQSFNIAHINPSWQDVTGQTSLVFSGTLLAGIRYRITWIRSGTREVASFVTVTAAPPTATVTYSPAAPAVGDTVTAILSDETGTGTYRWQIFQNGAWTFLASTLEVTLIEQDEGKPIRFTWVQNGETQIGPEVTVIAPVVTYSPSGNLMAGDTITATLADTTGVTFQTWQEFIPAGDGFWSNKTGEAFYTIPTSTSVGTRFRFSWIRNGVTEFGPEIVTS